MMRITVAQTDAYHNQNPLHGLIYTEVGETGPRGRNLEGCTHVRHRIMVG